MSARIKQNSFKSIKQVQLKRSENVMQTWYGDDVEVDILEQMRFNVSQLEELNSRFNFLLEELSEVLIRQNP